MAKTCEYYKGCNNPVFSKGHCIIHQRKTGPTPRRTPIKKISNRHRKLLGERKNATLKDREFFLEIWNEREHVDFETGQPIYGEPLNLYFHHVLPKRKNGGYPQYRYKKWNIIIVSWDTHTNCENHQWKKVPKIAAYRDELLKKYT